MPGPKPRLHLPYADWPASDRLLWEQAFRQDDPFSDVRLAKASQDRCMWSWRRFLGFLTNNEPEALETPPAERLTIARVKLLARHFAETNAPNSVAAMVEGLYMAARVMMPDRDWNWLRTIKSRLHAAVAAHSPIEPMITSMQLLELGLKLMDENKPEPTAKLDVHRAVAFRNGLMATILAYVPIRPKNLTSIQIGRHIIQERERWFIIVPREETKTGKRHQFEVPKILVPYLRAYLDVVRPTMLRGKNSKCALGQRQGWSLVLCRNRQKHSRRFLNVSACGFHRTTRATLPSIPGRLHGPIRSRWLGICFITAGSTLQVSTIGSGASKPAGRMHR